MTWPLSQLRKWRSRGSQPTETVRARETRRTWSERERSTRQLVWKLRGCAARSARPIPRHAPSLPFALARCAQKCCARLLIIHSACARARSRRAAGRDRVGQAGSAQATSGQGTGAHAAAPRRVRVFVLSGPRHAPTFRVGSVRSLFARATRITLPGQARAAPRPLCGSWGGPLSRTPGREVSQVVCPAVMSGRQGIIYRVVFWYSGFLAFWLW